MGKAAQRRRDEKRRALFETHGDARSSEEQTRARAMLDALQWKLEDDALREDGFYFVDGEYVAARRPRTTAGMNVRTFDGHTRRVKSLALVCFPQGAEQDDSRSFLVTFGLDRIGIWDFRTTEQLASLDVSHSHARFICGAASAAGTSASSSCLRFADANNGILASWQLDRMPQVHTFDASTASISKPSTQHSPSYCTSHQQHIAAITFSHSGTMLATCSWDSTCMLWQVHDNAPSCQQDTDMTAASTTLTLLHIFPVHEEGASYARFTFDDQQLVAVGECVVKVWDVSTAAPVSPDSSADCEKLWSSEGRRLEAERAVWEAAMPFELTPQRSMELFMFDEALLSMVGNHEWQYFREHDASESLRLRSPESAMTRATKHKENKQNDFVTQASSIHALGESSNQVTKDRSMSLPTTSPRQAAETPRPANQEGEFEDSRPSYREHASSTVMATSISNAHTDVELVLKTATRDSFQLSAEKTEQLERYYKQLTQFDFGLLLNPAIPFPGQLDSNEDQSGEGNNAEARLPSTAAITPKELIWNPLRPDAGGKLLHTFTKVDDNGFFVAHTSAITCCAVAKQVDMVVTVALDKCIKFWSLTQGKVFETIRNAHAAPITCCALTLSSQETTVTCMDLMLATGGKDNLVKVWRQRENGASTECIYTFCGHYDAIACCVFDPSGVFLTSAGDDTNVITWRVVPSSPDQPKQPTLVSADKFGITISWDEPLANGSQLLHYVIHTKQATSLAEEGHDIVDIPESQVPAKYTTKTVEKLQPGIQYTFQLAAVNAIGTSPFSEATLPIETLAFVPSQIEQPVQYSDREAVRIRLSWKQPSANGAFIQSYTIRCIPENNVFVPVLEMSIPSTDLEPAAPLASTDADIIGKKKATLTKEQGKTKKKKETALTRLREVKTMVAGNGSDVKAIEPKSQQKLPPASVFYSVIVEGLWPGEIYQFVVAAENRCGLGAFSRVSDYVKMDCIAPDPPPQPVIVNIQKRQVDIVWEKPRCNGSEILQYMLEWIQYDQVESIIVPGARNDNNSGTTSSYGPVEAVVPDPVLPVSNSIVLLTRSITGTSYTLQGLEPGQPLRVWLSASNLIDNKICTSELSCASEVATTLCDVPDTPARPALIQPSAHTLLLVFTPPKCNGLEIQSYDVTLYFEEVQFGITNRQVFCEFKLWVSDCEAIPNAGFASAFTIKKLRGSTYYSVELRAINELGASTTSECSALVSTKPPTVPARMLEPVIRDIEPGRAKITWAIPEHDGGAPLLAFHLQYSAQPSSTYSSNADNLGENIYKALFDQEVTIYHGQELLATFLRPKTAYRFRVASSNTVGKAPFSKKSVTIHTPSLVEFTITNYFADRPELEHVKARYIQVTQVFSYFAKVMWNGC